MRFIGHVVPQPRLRIVVTETAAAVLQLGVLCAALGRGSDYALPPAPRSTSTLTTVENLAPIAMWGAVFLTAALAGLLGLYWPRYCLNSAGHAVLAVTYGTFGLGALFSGAQWWPPNDWRTGIGWLAGAAVVHAVLADSSWTAWRLPRVVVPA